ncbi:MAG: sugar ABC transporter substrate-binding protein [Synergistaceae bacterium]|nr:sugar ABC transporter substrate-binding protein [Synergistaceae bacterium]
MSKKFTSVVLAALMLLCAGAAFADINWKACEGTTLNVMFNEHTYAQAIIAKLADFEKLTGIKVVYSTTPETNYFDKLNTALSSRTGDPDIFMTGAYQTWEYAPAGYMEPLDAYINDKAKTSETYKYDDFIPGIINALRWDLVPGHPVGNGKLWALPMGWEINTLTYNKKIFEAKGLKAPTTTKELYDVSVALKEHAGSGTYGLAVRGTRDWGTIHPAYMSLFATWGGKDFEIENGKLVCKLDSKEAIAMTDYWVKLIKAGGAPQWSTYGWELCGADLGAGKAAMMWDADRGGYTQNVKGASAEAGNLAFSGIPLPEGVKEQKSNLWTWAMGMNAYSKNKDAAWYFLQYFTTPEFMLYSGTEGACTDTPRQSVMSSKEYQDIVGEAEGYLQSFKEVSANASIFFTPQPYFFETTTMWAEVLQDLVVTNKYASTEEAMKQLAAKLTDLVSDLEVK